MDSGATPDPGPLAKFLASWGRLIALGVPSAKALEALSGEGPPAWRSLAGQLVGDGDREEALAAHPGLPSWLVPLLSTAPAPKSEGLLLAAAQLLSERGLPWTPARTWARLGVLHSGGARAGDALGALAHEAREHGRKGLAEVLNSAARKARGGASLGEALQAAGGYTVVERLVVERIEGAGLEAALQALNELSGLGEESAARESAPEEDPLARLADAATPLKRGFERVLTGIEGMLGIDRASERESAEALARATLHSRGDGGPSEPLAASAPADRPAPVPAGPPTSTEPVLRRKTIGGDSGPVRVNELHASRKNASGPDGRASWLTAFEEARARMALIEIQPGESGVADQLRRELKVLRSEARGQGLAPEELQALAELQTRFDAWARKHEG